jgi:subtilisin family serine protease
MKVMVLLGKDKRNLLQFVKDNSNNVIADYGQSVLVDVDDRSRQQILSQGLKIRDIKDASELEVSGYKINTARPEARLARNDISGLPKEGRGYYILQLVGPMHIDWKHKLDEIGVTVYQQVTDNNNYLIGLDNINLEQLNDQTFIQSILPYYPELKIAPSLVSTKIQSRMSSSFTDNPAIKSTIAPSQGLSEPQLGKSTKSTTGLIRDGDARNGLQKEEGDLDVILFDSSFHQQFKEFLADMDLKIVRAEDNRFIVSASAEDVENTDKLQRIISLPYVRRIDPYAPNRSYNEVAEGIIKVDIIKNNHHLSGNGQVIAVADTGLDTGKNDQTMSADFRGRIVAIHPRGRPFTRDASDLNGHGTHVAGSVLGSGSHSNGRVRGMAPNAKLVFQSTEDSNGQLTGVPVILENLYVQAMKDGATIFTNSWGKGCRGKGDCPFSGQYEEQSKSTDNFMFKNRDMLVLFAAGNDGDQEIDGDRLVSPPGTAKNVITVGASESLRSLPSGIIPTDLIRQDNGKPFTLEKINEEADNTNNIAGFSSIGPALHDRQKPDVVAPGTWILSTRSSVCVEDWLTGDRRSHDKAVGYGLPNGPIMGHGNKMCPSPTNFDPAFSKDYMYSSGTSMAAPITAGVCALIREFLVNKGIKPSAALIKALLINGTVSLGHPPSLQGWGLINLDKTISPWDLIKFDDSIDSALATGEINSYSVTVDSLSSPLTITLVWRDPPGDTLQNRLHLRVTGANSEPIFSSDDENNILNNVQKISIPNPTTNKYEVEIEGVNITKGIPELPEAVRQDYALVVSNCKILKLT